MVNKVVVAAIKIYQKTLSPDHSWLKKRYSVGYCKFSPSCSQYCLRAIEKYGIIRGGWLGIKRILRCNPWNKGGKDPVHS